MANLAATLNQETRRLARRELRRELTPLRKTIAQQRRELAALKQQVRDQARTLSFLQKREKGRLNEQPAEQLAENARFSPTRLRGHRERLGLSAANYARLAGVSAQSIYLWEQGKTRPRAKQLAALVALRDVGKREAQRRLEMLNGKA